MSYDQGNCKTHEVLGHFSKNKNKALAHYLDFVSKADDIIMTKTDREMAPEQDEIEFEINKMSLEKKDKLEVIMSFENRTGVKVENLKKKYLKEDMLELRNCFIKEIIKYGAMTQSEVSRDFGHSDGYVSRICRENIKVLVQA